MHGPFEILYRMGTLLRLLSLRMVLPIALLISPLGSVWFPTQTWAAENTTKEFQAGAATSNITPPLGSSINGRPRDRRAEGIHDELHARALVLDNGDSRMAYVMVDSCMIRREVYDQAKRMVFEAIGLPAESILMSATHTHSAPTAVAIFQSEPDADYLRFLTGRIADAVRRARNNLEPARIGWGVGKVPDQGFNRRWHMKTGTIPPNPFGVIDRVETNPPVGSPDLLEPAGPTDPDLSVISVQAKTGRPIALLANYSLHYVGGTEQQISADYFGAFSDRIQQLLQADQSDPPLVGILSNGTSGDINSINFRGKRESKAPFERIQLVADRVASEAYRVYQGIHYRDWVRLAARQTELELGVRLPDKAEVIRAKQIMMRAEGPVMKTLEELYARETMLLSDFSARVSLILQTFRIGDLGIAAIPCEVFVEIGLQLKAKSPLHPTFTISLANGYNGYLPTPEHHDLGGYETWRARSSYLEVEAAPKITSQLLNLFEKLKDTTPTAAPQ